MDEAYLAAAAGRADATQESPEVLSDAAVLAYKADGRALDRSRPPALDPRETGLFGPRTPVSRHNRVVAYCLKDGKDTVQDVYEVIVTGWVGLSGKLTTTRRSAAGKVGGRGRFSGCAVCGCLYPADDQARGVGTRQGRGSAGPCQAA